MAENTNYIGIAMGLDVTDLKAGLSEANKQIQLANSQFKAASSGMDDWTKSTEGLSAKVKQLDTVLKMQKAKLAGLNAEYEKVVKEQGEGSEAARKLQVQINNQQAVVNRTQKEYKNFASVLKQAEEGTIDLANAAIKSNGEIKEFGDNAKTAGDNVQSGFGRGVAVGIAGGIAAIGAAAVAAVGSFLSLAESTREAREDMAKLTSSFEGAGMTADTAKGTFTDLFKVIGETDTAVEASQQIALLAKSEEDSAKWAEQAANVTATFGDALKPETFYESANETLKLGEATGAYAQMLEGTGIMSVEAFNDKLATMATEQEKQAFMLELSEKAMGEAGKAYEETAGDIMEAREAEAKLSLAMQELGEIAEPIMTTLKLLAVDLLESVKPFVDLIGEGLTGALNGTEGATDKLAEGLSGILTVVAEKAIQILPTLLETLASLISTLLPQLISTLAGIIPILIQTLADQLPTILQAIISGFSQILTSIGEMLPELIPVIIDAVLLIVETLLDNIDQLIDAGIELLMGLADGLIKALPRLIDKIPVIIDKLMGAFSRNGPKLVEAGIELLVKLAGGLIKAIPQLVSKIPEIISSFVSGFAEYYSNLGEVGKGMIEGIWEGITGGADWLKKKIEGFAGDVAEWFKKTFKIGSPSKLIEDKVGIFVGQGVVPTRPGALAKVKKTLVGFSNYVSENLGGIKDGLSVDTGGGSVGRSTTRGNTIIDARQTINYNGKLSRKQIKRQERDHYNAVRMKLKTEGAI